jgi:GNAT superfamily N-acetyltransferase
MSNYESKLTVRVANESDLDEIMVIIEAAKEFIHSQGIHQWVNGYPSSDVILDDIKSGRSYVLVDEDNGAIMATSFISFDGESTYDKIYEGEWSEENAEFCVIHRVAVNSSYRRSGMANAMFEYAAKLCRERGCKYLRADTHRDNLKMQGAMKKGGFFYRGIIYLENGHERFAFEKTI